jgi:hypothetical protein
LTELRQGRVSCLTGAGDPPPCLGIKVEEFEVIAVLGYSLITQDCVDNIMRLLVGG